MAQQSQKKIDAIYDLREAVASKVRLEIQLDRAPSTATREALLDATLDMEAKTQHAIEVCHECGGSHEAPGAHVERGAGKVIRVDFGAGDGRESEAGGTEDRG